ncbi:hypothetical protein EZ428_17940 [Pedobacter frigiditerrae]|uniref:Uncharacterized protein n=1 Tax=Pedobacter frigiditerrae TaxID=2530452 RepID=A0A4R0MPG9_9SPHI|nr:hypothetical protein [Pedobacter frigiditerrae]TCC88523.1 hypothetical protein EZ428_17940 [Pedobacter frigiditerrae]
MKTLIISALFFLCATNAAIACEKCSAYANSEDFNIKAARITQNKLNNTLEFEITVGGKAGETKPKAIWKFDMAPVLGYVFPTTLKPEDIGFSSTQGIVALALTSHPDFDDTPLWDENNDRNFANDGILWHPHWVILIKDDRVGGGLSVKEHKKADLVTKPKTAPEMNMYMDSPGYPVATVGKVIRVSVPLFHVNNQTKFKFDAVACYMEISAPDGKEMEKKMDKPMLGVYNVFSILSKNLSLPFEVK